MRIPDDPIPRLSPDLAIEVLSASNTPREMKRKYTEYFNSDVRLVWEIDPRAKTARVFTSPEDDCTLSIGDALMGDSVLPGFVLPLSEFG